MDKSPINLTLPESSAEPDPPPELPPSEPVTPPPPKKSAPPPDLSTFDPIDNPFVPPASSIPPVAPTLAQPTPAEPTPAPTPTEPTPTPTEPTPTPALANTITQPGKPRASLGKRFLLAAIPLAIIIGGGVLLNVLGFFVHRETLACTVTNQGSTISMNFNYANGSVDTADIKFKLAFTSPSEAQQVLDRSEDDLRKMVSQELTGKRNLDTDMQLYVEDSSIIVDIKISHDLLSSVSLASGVQKTASISEAKTGIEGQLPGMICTIK